MLGQEIVKIMVIEISLTAVGVPGFLLPFHFVFNIGGMGLFPDPLVHIPLSIADFRPAIMSRHSRSGIGVNHGNHGCIAFYLYPCHLRHLLYMGFNEIDFILGQAILLYSCLSMSGMDWDQLISDNEEKSCIGT